MSKEKEQVIEDIVKEVEGINNIVLIRFILDVVKSFKESGKWDVA